MTQMEQSPSQPTIKTAPRPDTPGSRMPLSAVPVDRLVQVEKVSSLAFLTSANRLWLEGRVLLIGDGSPFGLSPKEIWTTPAASGWWESEFQPDEAAELAQISSTSGTTGDAKAIAISRQSISDTVTRLVSAMEIDGTIREYIGVPATFSFGLGRARVVAAVGGRAFLPEHGFRPDEIQRMLISGEINALSAVPSMLRTLIAHPELIDKAGGRLRWLEIGSQYMSAGEKRSIRTLFPNAAILQHYGLTEASRSTFLRIDQASDDELASVGRATAKGELRVRDDCRIEVRGPHVASGLVRAGRLYPLTDNDGWLTTSDLGELRGESLHYLGRADDVANIAGVKVSTELFERMISGRLSESAEFAACVITDALRGERVAIGWLRADEGALHEAALGAGSELGLRRADVAMVKVESLPLTDTKKVRRSELAREIERKLAQIETAVGDTQPSNLNANERRIASIWSEALGVTAIGAEDRFYDLGGDSLSAITVMLRAEQVGLPQPVMQRMFAGETVAQIAKALEGSGTHDHLDRVGEPPVDAVRADALNAVRGLMALSIVLSHWGPFFAERMGPVGAAAWGVIAPLLRIGTPGFAMVYGMGLGLFYFRQVRANRPNIRQRILRNTGLLIAGVLLIAVAQVWQIVATDSPFGTNWPERLFYGVLLFYALVVPTSMFWLRQVGRARDPVFGALLLSGAAYGTHILFLAVWPTNAFSGWASLGWHMLVAPYAYPRLLGAAALGLAGALWLMGRSGTAELQASSGKWGLVLAGLGFVLVAQLPGGWAVNAGGLVATVAFAGVTLMLYAGAVLMIKNRFARPVLQLAITCGLIAFPIFIAHGLVIPMKTALEAYGVAELLALGITVGLFVSAMTWLGWRVHRFMFGSERVA